MNIDFNFSNVFMLMSIDNFLKYEKANDIQLQEQRNYCHFSNSFFTMKTLEVILKTRKYNFKYIGW